jgi:hypothetical protein
MSSTTIKWLIVVLISLAVPALAEDRYEIEIDPNGRVEMHQKYDHDTLSRFRGEISPDGSVRMRNRYGDRLRGSIDRNGYGTLRDQEGNRYKVRP